MSDSLISSAIASARSSGRLLLSEIESKRIIHALGLPVTVPRGFTYTPCQAPLCFFPPVVIPSNNGQSVASLGPRKLSIVNNSIRFTVTIAVERTVSGPPGVAAYPPVLEKCW